MNEWPPCPTGPQAVAAPSFNAHTQPGHNWPNCVPFLFFSVLDSSACRRAAINRRSPGKTSAIKTKKEGFFYGFSRIFSRVFIGTRRFYWDLWPSQYEGRISNDGSSDPTSGTAEWWIDKWTKENSRPQRRSVFPNSGTIKATKQQHQKNQKQKQNKTKRETAAGYADTSFEATERNRQELPTRLKQHPTLVATNQVVYTSTVLGQAARIRSIVVTLDCRRSGHYAQCHA